MPFLFDGSVEQIANHIQTNLNSMDLNEAHSCFVYVEQHSGKIIISGDEDRVEVEVITPKKFIFD